MQLEDPAALLRPKVHAVTVAELIRWYIQSFETISHWQRSKQSHLEFLERHALGQKDALKLTAATLIEHVRSRRAQGAGPATVANDLIWIGVVLRAARSVRELPVRPEIVQEARNACGELRLIGKSRKRSRRPTSDELTRLREYFARRDATARIPMLSIMEFALHSARREAEICRLEWRPSLDSYDRKARKAADGSMDVYFGPKAPDGCEANWIATVAGKDWFPYFRFYGPSNHFSPGRGSYPTSRG